MLKNIVKKLRKHVLAVDPVNAELSDEQVREYTYERAKGGHNYEQYSYGGFCLIGFGGPVNIGHAEYWLNIAANKGVVEAQFLLGECYFEGIHLHKDIEKGRYWLIVAATNEHEGAKYYIDNQLLESKDV